VCFYCFKNKLGLTQTNQTGLTQFSGLVGPGPQVPKSVQDWVSLQNQNLRVDLGRDGQIHYFTLGIHYIRTKYVSQGLFTIILFMLPETFPFFVLIGRQRISSLDFRGTIRHPHNKKDMYLGCFFTVTELESLFSFRNYRGIFLFLFFCRG
jgi:hypothetical protein